MQLQTFSGFHTLNPDFDILRFNFHDRAAVASLQWDGMEQATTLHNLKTYQRLLHIHPQEEVAEKLINNQFHSAHAISDISLEHFIQLNSDSFHGDDELLKKVYDKAVDIRGRTALLWGRIKDMIASPYYKNTMFGKVPAAMEDFYASLPSYSDMFGSIACTCEACMSMTSPAAYFTDLMRLVQEYITVPNDKTIPAKFRLSERRPDLFDLPLDCAHTETSVKYLQLVNDVIRKRLQAEKPGVDVLYELALAPYPFNLPFNFPLEEIRKYLEHFDTSLAAVYEALFATPAITGREQLDITREEEKMVTTPVTNPNDLSRYYNWQIQEGNLNGLERTDNFTHQTGLDNDQLRELLYQQLTQEEILNITGDYKLQSPYGDINIHFNQQDKKVTSTFNINSTAQIHIEGTLDGHILNAQWTERSGDTLITTGSWLLSFDVYGYSFQGYLFTKGKEGHTEFSGTKQNNTYKNVLHNFYINQVLTDSYLLLETRIGTAIPPETWLQLKHLYLPALDRLNRFIRLAAYLQWSFTELDWALQSLGLTTPQQDIDANVIADLSKINKLVKDYQLSVTEACSLFCDIRTTGIISNSQPRSYFDQVFNYPTFFYNAPGAPNPKPYHPQYAGNPFYNDAVLEWTFYKLPDTNDPTGNDKDNTIRLRLMAALGVNDAGLTAIAQYMYDRLPDKPATKTLQLTVGTLSQLYRLAKLANYTGLDIASFLKVWTMMYNAGVKPLDNLIYISHFIQWMQAAPINIDQLEYILSGILSKNVTPPFNIDDTTQVLRDIDRNAPAWMVNDYAFTYRNITREESWEIVKQLKSQGFVSGNGIVLQKEISFDTMHTLIRLTETSLTASLIDEEQSKQAFHALAQNEYIVLTEGNTQGYLTGKYNNNSDLTGILFVDDPLQPDKIEEVKNILNHIDTLHSILACTPLSFVVKDVINDMESAVIFERLQQNLTLISYIDKYGILLSTWNDQVNLDFLFDPNDEKKALKIAEVRTVLNGVKSNIDHIVDTLKNIRKQQQQGVLEVLAGYFSAEPELIYVILFDFAFRLQDIDYMKLLLQPNRSEKDIEEIKKLFAITSRVLYLMQTAQVTAQEAATMVQKPVAFNLPAIDPAFVLKPVHIVSIFRFKQLVQQFNDATNALAKYLVQETQTAAALGVISSWNSDQIDLLTKFSGQFSIANVEGIWKLKSVFDIATATGVDVNILVSLFNLRDLDLSQPANWNSFLDNRKYLYDAVNAKYTDAEWQSVYDAISATFPEKERDALTGYFIAQAGGVLGIRNRSNLYQYLLLDVDMAGNVTTSAIQQGIGTVQLYIQRCLMNLEEGVQQVNIKPVWWQWMSSYRVWEANRKVFLYPENYFDPSLRKSKSEIYQDFCSELNESEVTEDNITGAFQNYLNRFASLANLVMVDAYFIDRTKDLVTGETNEDTLFVFGRTNTEPYQYYYRTARIHIEKEDTAKKGFQVLDWDYWHEMNISIQSQYITPVFIFNRLYICWVEVNKVTGAVFTEGTSTDTITYKASIKYSYYNFHKAWSAPQTLQNDIVLSVRPNDYLDQMEQYIDRLNMNFEFDSPFWNKPYLFTYEESPGQENLVVCFGDLTEIPAEEIEMPEAPVFTGNTDKDAFNQTFFRAIDTTRKAADEKKQGYNTFLPATILNYRLQKNTRQLIIENVASGLPKPYRGLINRIQRSLIVSETSNVLYDNYMSNFVPPDIYGIMIAGGEEKEVPGAITISDRIDLYDAITGSWSVEKLSEPRSNFCSVAVGNKLLFAGGRIAWQNNQEKVTDALDIYNGNSGNWIVEKLSVPKCFAVATSIGEWAFIAGGRNTTNPVHTIDIYNAATGALRGHTLRVGEGRQITGIAAGKTSTGAIKVLIVYEVWPNSSYLYYNPVTNEQTQGPTLPFYVRHTATVGNKAYLFGLTNLHIVDMATGLTNNLTHNKLVENMAFTVCGDKIYFAGGLKLAVEVFNTVSLQWEASTRSLSQERGYLTASAIGTRIVFAGGYHNGARYNTVDIFDALQPAFRQTKELSRPRANLTSVQVNIRTDLVQQPNYIQLLGKLPGNAKDTESIKNIPGWFMVNTGAEQFLVMPDDPLLKQIREIVQVKPWDSIGDLTIDSVTTGKYTDSNIALKDLPFRFMRLTTQTIQNLSNRLFIGGFNKLLEPASQELTEIPFEQTYAPTNQANWKQEGYVPGAISFALPNPWSGYFKELFFYIPLMIADSLQMNQRFEAAKKWYEFIFNPTASDRSDPEYYWRFIALRKIMEEPLEKILTDDSQISLYANDPFNADAIAWHRKTALQKAVVMKYIKNLISWGDQLFTQDTRESIGQAALLYMLAGDLLGKKPAAPALCNTPNTKTFRDILNKYKDNIPDFLIELENFYVPDSGGVLIGNNPLQHLNAYFGMMENPEFTQCWDMVEDRLFKIRHSMSIQGVERSLSLFGSPIDPRLLQRAVAAGISSGALGQFPVPLYRFTYMLDRARNLTGSLIQLGSSLLSVIEKKDAEQLALLRAGQELTMLRLQRNIKEQQIADAMYMMQSAEQSLQNAIVRSEFYALQLQTGLIPGEIESLNDMYNSMIANEVSSVLRAASSVAYALPNVGAPTAMTYGGAQIGSSIAAAATVPDLLSIYYNFQSQKKSINAAYDRRRNDWELQLNMANYDKEQYQAALDAANVRIAIAQQDLSNHDKSIAQSNEVENFLITKFSNKELYQWMLSRLSVVYFQTYKLAYDAALAAEKALQFERDTEESYIVNTGYWDSLKKGLMAGESLQLSLNQMEKAYIANNVRELEIEKTISLRREQYSALEKLITTGDTVFDITELLYDYDFPGHYKRKIRSVSISIPAVVGPYQNLNATLTQTANKIVLKPDLNAVSFLLGNANTKEPEATTLRSNWRTNQLIALYSGINENGVFELNYRDERYLPFEGTGAVSSWRLQIDNETIRSSISDVIIKVRYAAYYGGEAFARAVRKLLPPSAQALIAQDIRKTLAEKALLAPQSGTVLIDMPLTEEVLSQVKPMQEANEH